MSRIHFLTFDSIVSVHRPIKLIEAPHTVYVAQPHIYPVHIPVLARKTTTIKKIATPDPKKSPYITSKYVLPYRASDKGNGFHKKPPFLVHFPTLKSVVYHPTNYEHQR